jgi:hypothetical protein
MRIRVRRQPGCVCIYIGTQQAFDQFKASQLPQQRIDEQLVAGWLSQD